MRVIFITLLAGIYSLNAYSQIDSLKTIRLDVTILVTNLEKAKEELNIFFKKNNVVPDMLNQFTNQFESSFALKQNTYYTFVDEIEDWGIVTSKKLTSANYTEKLNEVNQEIARLEKQIEEYESLVKEVDVKSESHIKYWERLERARTILQQQKVLQKEYLAGNQQFKIKLRVGEQTGFFFCQYAGDSVFVSYYGKFRRRDLSSKHEWI